MPKSATKKKSSTKKFTAYVTSQVEIEIDETKFDEKMLASFRELFYPFYTIEEHVEHLAQLCSRGLVKGVPDDEFIEGYGKADEAGISVYFVEVTDVDVERPR